MIRQYLQLLRILLDRRVTTVPRRVLTQLSLQGKQRLPEAIGKSLDSRLPGFKGLAFMHRWLKGEQLTIHKGQWVINSFLPPFPGRHLTGCSRTCFRAGASVQCRPFWP